MRIIGGALKGRRFNPPKNLPIRPTTDFAKEGIFNILDNNFYFESLKVLDLFSGTGNISFEFASRGSKDITCVDENAGCIRFIENTIGQLNIESILPIQIEVVEYLQLTSERFDIIFADPPYSSEDIEKLPILVFNNELLSDEGWLIIEHQPKCSFKKHSHFRQERKYGSSVFSIFSDSQDEG